ncbi:MAG: hypothetical protein QGF46_07965, partial [Planctomycetota bacterium]|nr:hypothetical protein [Planctomycetota bacterium]
KFIAGELRPIAEKFFSVAHQALPHLGIDVIIARTEFMVGALFHWMHTQIQVGRILAPDQAQLSESSFVAEQLIKFCTAGFNDE